MLAVHKIPSIEGNLSHVPGRSRRVREPHQKGLERRPKVEGNVILHQRVENFFLKRENKRLSRKKIVNQKFHGALLYKMNTCRGTEIVAILHDKTLRGKRTNP